MPYTPQQHKEARIYAMYGMPIKESVPLDQFESGEGIIILNQKGEPMMTGVISQLDEDPTSATKKVYVGNQWWREDEYLFRKL